MWKSITKKSLNEVGKNILVVVDLIFDAVDETSEQNREKKHQINKWNKKQILMFYKYFWVFYSSELFPPADRALPFFPVFLWRGETLGEVSKKRVNII